ncbi:MAG TPA: adenine phosphoribosyltransferase [Armatimonadota bacterium]
MDKVSPRVRSLVREFQDFPKEGILFRDITPVLMDPPAFQEVIEATCLEARNRRAEAIVGIESRGFVFGAPVAARMGLPFIPVRKMGKLPGPTLQAEYALEYGTNVVEIHEDALRQGQRTLIVDDLLATGGTASAAGRLVEDLGAVVAGYAFLIELAFLKGRAALEGYPVLTLLTYGD